MGRVFYDQHHRSRLLRLTLLKSSKPEFMSQLKINNKSHSRKSQSVYSSHNPAQSPEVYTSCLLVSTKSGFHFEMLTTTSSLFCPAVNECIRFEDG
jgi:hypothetical protein